MKNSTFTIRTAIPDEYKAIGKLMVKVYSRLPGFPDPIEQPAYYELLLSVGTFTQYPGTELLVAVNSGQQIGGAVVFFNDMKYYGSGGTATQERNAAGFRLLAVHPDARGHGLGKNLSLACIAKAKSARRKQVIIHSTESMKIAWGMYERLGFKRSGDLDFQQGALDVFGFRLNLLEG